MYVKKYTTTYSILDTYEFEFATKSVFVNNSVEYWNPNISNLKVLKVSLAWDNYRVVEHWYTTVFLNSVVQIAEGEWS